VGDLGIARLESRVLSIRIGEEGAAARFGEEPRIGAVAGHGPAAGKLREGDLLVAIDGTLITTRAGGERLLSLKPGVPVSLTVRREGREIPVRLTPGSVCLDAVLETLEGTSSLTAGLAPPPPVAPAPRAERSPRPERAPSARPLPRGWFGIGMNCQACGAVEDDDKGVTVWTFSSPPVIYRVDPDGPAARAGIQRGDVILKIDGVEIDSEEGGRRFGAVRPGERVQWTLERDGQERSVTLVAGARPGDRTAPIDEMLARVRALSELQDRAALEREMAALERELVRLKTSAAAAQRPSPGSKLRYAGTIGQSDVEVRGVGNVVVDEGTDEVVITTRDAMVRIKPTGKPAPKAAGKR
jgi:membrane-associated protease RseP (regulator of RpoE activity)